jgi:tRNA (guanosine-2'-O-)-methyltransferase
MTPERLEKLEGVLSRRQPDLTILAENLHKPRNFSALIRTCDAVGIHEVNVVPGKFHPKRHWHTSSGTEKWIWLQTHDSVPQAASALKKRGFRLVAAHLSDQACDFREVDYTLPTVLFLGTELFGVSEQALDCVDQQISIPMQGMSQSLNVSVAAAIVLYEVQRQRQAAGMYDECRLDPDDHLKLRFEWLHPVVAKFCRERDLGYPTLDEHGDIDRSFKIRS